jgi:hypothetical protein
VEFFLDIIYRFGVPNSIITGNGTLFTGKKFLWFYDDYGIRVDWASVAHPRTNGQVERANTMILQALKPCIFDRLDKFMGGGGTGHALGVEDDSEPVHRLYTVLHGIWRRGHPAN